jgi:hypothetical protein
VFARLWPCWRGDRPRLVPLLARGSSLPYLLLLLLLLQTPLTFFLLLLRADYFYYYIPFLSLPWPTPSVSFPPVDRYRPPPGGLCCCGGTAELSRILQSTVAYVLHIVFSRKTFVYKTPWPLVRKRTIPTERPPPTFVDRGVSRGQRSGSRTVVNLSLLDRSRYFSFK